MELFDLEMQEIAMIYRRDGSCIYLKRVTEEEWRHGDSQEIIRRMIEGEAP